MENNLVVTRTRILLPRRRAELLSRPRLLNGMLEMLDNKLIIIAAPAGYGKTSLLIDVAYHVEWPVCWYALDQLDQDVLRFAAHFIAAINLRFPKFGAASRAVLQNMTQERLNLDLLLSAIINDAYKHISEHFIMVLDDYHLVNESKLVNQFVSRFIQDVDENCHLMIASRTLISLPDMPLLVTRSQVGGLSIEELTFRPEEIRELLLQNQHLTISDAMAGDLARQTEGWVTGLLLSAQLLGQLPAERQALSRVAGVGLYEYLTQQVFDRQPPAIQDFLLRTSLLEEFDADFCAEVINPALGIEEDWDELMANATRNNLFILPVEDERLWLRYHHLFSEFLQNRIRRERPEEAQKIQLSLAEAYTRHGQWEQVYRLYQRLGKQEAIINLIQETGQLMVASGQLNTLSTWLAALPEKILSEHPFLLSIQGSVAVMRGESRQGLALFNQAIVSLSQTNRTYHLALALVWRSANHRLLGEYSEALADAEEALWLAGKNPEMELIRAEACKVKGAALFQQGQLKEALHWLGQSEAAFRALEDGNNSAKLLLEIGIVNKASGNLVAAEQAYGRALEHWEKTNNSTWQANLLNNLGVLQHLRGDYVTAASNFERAIQHAKISSYPRLEAFALTSIGDLYRDLEAPQEAQEAYRQAWQIAQRIKDRYLLFYLNLAQGALAASQKDAHRAVELFEAAGQMADESGSQGEQNLYRLEMAVFNLSRQEYHQALNALESALNYFEEEGQQAETGRANLYLALACAFLKDTPRAARHFKYLASLLTMPERCPPLVAAGRDFKGALNALKHRPEFASAIGELLAQVDLFERNLPGLRNQVRRRASVVPFAPPQMIIHALGKVEVKIDERLVTSADWQTQTARDLFFFILDHPEGLTKEAIGTVFWPESSLAELKLRFKNAVYRLRRAAGRDAILFDDEIYRFNTTTDYEYDVEAFLKEIKLCQQADDTRQKIEHSKTAISLYRGPYLPEINETWVVAEREHLHQIYIEALMRLANLYLESGQYDAALETCQVALWQDRCLEDAHRLAMRIHAARGNRAALVRQYEMCKQVLLDEYNSTPSPQTEQLYETLSH
jgi:ATP/maltotriose-dependent transcriptional regulator MalT/DNA-binding SARP family transcriptional activator